MVDHAKVLAAISESLRSVVAAVEVGAKVAGDMLNEVEQKLLAAIANIDKDHSP